MKYINQLLLLTFVALAVHACEKPFDYNQEDIPFFEGLAPPAANEGYQIHIPPFPVPSQYEREIFVRMDIGNTEDIYVNKFEVICRPGTHHMIAYGYDNENDPSNPPVGVLRDQNLPDGRGNFSLTMGSGSMYCGVQEAAFLQEYPKGIAIKIPANATLDMNSHYFNLTDNILFGEVYLNLYTIPKDSVTEILVYDDVDNEEELYLPPRQATTIDYTDLMYERTEIRQMFSHMHKRGYQFQVYKVGGANDGELLYEAFDYQHPPYQFFDPPLVIEAGEGLRTMVAYNNETDREITFGVTSEDEMGILFYNKIEK